MPNNSLRKISLLVFFLMFSLHSSSALAFNPFTSLIKAVKSYVASDTKVKSSAVKQLAAVVNAAPSTLLLAQAKPPVVYVAPQNSSTTVSDAKLLSLISTLLNKPEFIAKLRGLQGPQGSKGDPGTNAMYPGQPAYISQPSSPPLIPLVFGPVGIVQPDLPHNFSGASFFTATELLSDKFTANIAKVSNLTVSGTSTFAGGMNINSGTVNADDIITKSPWIDVRAYGAIGDGVTDDSAAIQAALNAAGGRPIFVPAGTYVIRSGLTYNTTADHVASPIIIGAGRQITIFDNQVANGSMLTMQSTVLNRFQRGGRLRDFTITTSDPINRPPASNGIYIKALYQLEVDNVAIFNLTGDGIHIAIDANDSDGPNGLTFNHMFLQRNDGFGINVATTGTSVENSFMVVENSLITGNLSGGIRWRGTEARILNNGITLNEGVGGFQAQYNGSSNANLVMENNDFEHNKNRDLDIDGLIGGIFTNNQFIGTLCAYPKTEEIRIGNTAGSSNLVFIANEIREGTCQSPNTAFSIGASTSYTRIERTRWSLFDAAGQTRFVDNGLNTEIFDDGREFPYPESALNTTLSSPGSYTPDLNKYKIHNLTFTAAGAYTINAPTTTGGSSGKEMTLDLYNNSGGVVTITFNGTYLLQSYSNPPTGVHRTVQLYFNSALGWVQSAQTWLGNPGFTAGSIPYTASDGSLTQNNAQLFWNNSSARLGIGTASPAHKIDAVGNTFLLGSDNTSDILRTNVTAKNMYIAIPHYTNAQSPLFLIGGQSSSAASDIYIGNSFTGNANAATSIRFATGLTNTTATGTERMRIDNVGNMKLAGTALRGTTEGTNHLDIFDGTAPVGTLTNGISLYSTAGELRVMDSAGNATLLSPHENEHNYWVFDSVNQNSGKSLLIDMELMMKSLNATFGWGYVHETIDGVVLPDPNAPLALPDTFWNAIAKKLTDWLGEAGNGIVKLFVGEVHITDKLCAGDICVNNDQLKNLLLQAGGISNNSAIPSGNDITSPTEVPSESEPEVGQPQTPDTNTNAEGESVTPISTENAN